MKILNAQQIKEVDTCSIQLQQINSIELMERAANTFTEHLLKFISPENKIHIYCGKGNNGGDGLAVARILYSKGFSVEVLIVEHSESASKDFLINYERLKSSENKVLVRHISSSADLIVNNDINNICIDAILGSGVNKPAEGILKNVIEFINHHYTKIFSIDVPSGMFLDKPNPVNSSVVKADYTFTFQLPKYSFLLPENADFVGEWRILDIGLSAQCIEKQITDFYTIDDVIIKSIYVPRKKINLKWDFGHALIIAGSKNMRGAAVLCAGAALRSGCGLVSIHSVEDVVSLVVQKYPECILSTDEGREYVQRAPDLKKFSAVAIGCGIGNNEYTFNVLIDVLKNSAEKKIVIDADGLNILSQHSDCVSLLQNKNIILSPHIREFDRLFGASQNHYERILKAVDIARQLKIVIVLKSSYTAVVLPSGKIYFNIISNSGLAKGGSGDVLTGIITSLCAKGYTTENAAVLAVYIHSLAGKFATEQIHSESVLPSDVIVNLSKAFNYIENV